MSAYLRSRSRTWKVVALPLELVSHERTLRAQTTSSFERYSKGTDCKKFLPLTICIHIGSPTKLVNAILIAFFDKVRAKSKLFFLLPTVVNLFFGFLGRKSGIVKWRDLLRNVTLLVFLILQNSND